MDEVLGVVVPGAQEGYLHVVGVRVAGRRGVEVRGEHLCLRERLVLLEAKTRVEDRVAVGELRGTQARGGGDAADGLRQYTAGHAAGQGDAADNGADGADGHGASLGCREHW